MGREVHFVVAVDVDNKTIAIDDSTYRARFAPSEGYYDTEKLEWFEDEDLELYNNALQILNQRAVLEKE